MSKQVILELALETQQGKLIFPKVVQGLLEVGVESYLVDFAAKQKIHYLTDGSTYTVPMILEPGSIAAEFSGADLLTAIHGAQADTVRYPEFGRNRDEHFLAPGVIGYSGVPNRRLEGDLLRP